MKTYKIMANETPQDVLKNNDVVVGHADTLDEAWRISLLHQRAQKFIAVWIEEVEEKKPRIVRSVERDPRTGVKINCVRVDGWLV